jgi:hypothetical protein
MISRGQAAQEPRDTKWFPLGSGARELPRVDRADDVSQFDKGPDLRIQGGVGTAYSQERMKSAQPAPIVARPGRVHPPAPSREAAERDDCRVTTLRARGDRG